MSLVIVCTFVGTAYFVFGENLDVYDDSNVTQKEFISAGTKFIEMLSKNSPIPIYKVYPTKSYKELVHAISHMREIGAYWFFVEYLFSCGFLVSLSVYLPPMALLWRMLILYVVQSQSFCHHGDDLCPLLNRQTGYGAKV